MRHRGSGIFLHVNGRGADAGCVSAPRRFIRSLVRAASTPPAVPVTRHASRLSELQVDVDGRTLTISNLDKVLYPRTGTTKGEVLNYYARISPVLLPHLRDRAVTRIRWPHGVQDVELLREERPGRHAVVGAHREVPTTGSRSAQRRATARSASRSSTTSPP